MRIGFASTEFLKQDDDGTFLGGGTLQYRAIVPARALEDAGHEVVVGTLFRLKQTGELCINPWDGFGFVKNDSGETLLARGCDVIVLQRYMNVGLSDYIEEARAKGQIVLSDVDDWFYGLPRSNQAYYLSHHDPVVRAEGELRGELGRRPMAHEVAQHLRVCEGCREAPDNNRDHYRFVTLACNAVICSTDFLAARYEEMGARTFLYRNAVDIERWRPQLPSSRIEPVLGWYGDVGFRASGDFDVLRSFLPAWLQADRSRRFVAMGGSAGDQTRYRQRLLEITDLRRFGERVKTLPGRPIGELGQAIAEMDVDVGLVPLERCDFNLSKSWLKAAEFAAAGIPVVASDLPEQRAFEALHLARDRRGWLDALEDLREPLYRAECARAARRRAEELAGGVQDYVAFIESLRPSAVASLRSSE